MKCEDPIYVMARKNHWLELRKNMKRWNIYPAILRSMWHGINSWCNSETPQNTFEFDTENETLEKNLKQACTDQTLIGWNHFALGRIAKSWKDCFLLGYSNDPHPEEKSDAVMKSMVEALWGMMLNTWRRRNDVEHGENMIYSRQDIKMIKEVINKIYVEVAPIVKNEDKWIFKKTEDERNKGTIVSTISWIETVYALYAIENNHLEDLRLRTEHILHRICLGSLFT